MKKKVLIVHAHPEPTSLTRQLVEVAVQTLQRQGHEVMQSDLYGMRWKAVFDEHDFPSRADPDRLSFIAESGHSYLGGEQAVDIATEQQKVLAADAVLFQFPLWWFGMPAIMKGWVDRVWAYGLAYGYKDGKKTSSDQVEFLAEMVKRFDIVSVEDGFAEDDWDGWKAFTKRVGASCLVVGDDLFTTSPTRVRRGIDERAANAVLVKPNQIGTLSRTVETIHLAHENGFKTLISHRSGETTDDAIAHIGAAFGCYGIKTGAVGGERIAKLNELIRIEEEL